MNSSASMLLIITTFIYTYIVQVNRMWCMIVCMKEKIKYENIAICFITFCIRFLSFDDDRLDLMNGFVHLRRCSRNNFAIGLKWRKTHIAPPPLPHTGIFPLINKHKVLLREMSKCEDTLSNHHYRASGSHKWILYAFNERRKKLIRYYYEMMFASLCRS